MTPSAPGDWWIATAEVPAALAEDLAEHVRETFALEPVLLERPGAQASWLEVYVGTREEADELAGQWAGWEDVRASSVRACPQREWATFWHHHFTTRPVGKGFLLIPAWEAEREHPDAASRIPVIIEPGLSFGTGDHFTTRFCLESLETIPNARRGVLLDAGTGSGVLALAAARLGFEDILGVDFDPTCLDSCRANARLNGLEHQVRFAVADVTGPWSPPRTCDVVCANILSSVLLAVADKLVSWTRSHLILSGIREPETDEVAEAFLQRGFRELVRDGDGEWAGLVMVRVEPT